MKKLKLALAVLLLLGMVATVQAETGVEHVFSWHLTSTSNVPCHELDDGYADPGTTWLELKLEEGEGQVANGTYTFGDLTVTLSNVELNDEGEPIGFDWSSNFGVDAIVVKDGEDGQNFYVYDGLTSPADGTVGPSGDDFRDPEAMMDTGLTTPGPEAGGTYKGISHISFCHDEGPTAVTGPGSSFNAEASAGRVALTWETGTEMDNAGFNLYRALFKDGPYTQINEALIAAEGDTVGGASYSFLDRPDYGTFYYKLEDVDLYGLSTLHGPVKVTVARRPLRRPLYRPNLPEF